MENKRDSMIFYRSFYECLKELDAEIKAEVYDAIFSYGLDFENVEFKNIVARSMFTLIKPQLDANIRRFENGKIPKNKQTISKTEANDKQNTSKGLTNVNVNDNVNKNDNVNVKVNDNVILLEKETKFDFKKSCIDYGFKIELINDWLQVRKNKKLTNTETAFNKFINQVEINEHDKNIILEKCIEKSWGGFESDWFKTNNINFNKINTGNNGKSRTDIQQEGKDRFREKFNQQNFGDWNRD
jgi:hypothetical protein